MSKGGERVQGKPGSPIPLGYGLGVVTHVANFASPNDYVAQSTPVDVALTLTKTLADLTPSLLTAIEVAETLVKALDDVVLVATATAESGTMPIGTVPIRYIVGQTKNIVPVETVGAWSIGVVRARVMVGPNNVVPVREAATEKPRVKVVLV